MVSVKSLEELGRHRLSPNFYLRDFLHSEISQIEGLGNIPVDPELLLKAGSHLCEHVLEPIQAKLGKISIRSGYRSPVINQIGNEKNYNCASNEKNHARHIWDVPDASGNFGATACVVVNAFVDHYEATGDWTVLGWWLLDHVPDFRDVIFFPKLAAFNINWYSGPVTERTISAQMPNPRTGKKGILTRTGWDNFEGEHDQFYRQWVTEKEDGVIKF